MKLYSHFCKKVITRYWKLLVSVSTFSIPVKREEKLAGEKNLNFILFYYCYFRFLLLLNTRACARTHRDTYSIIIVNQTSLKNLNMHKIYIQHRINLQVLQKRQKQVKHCRPRCEKILNSFFFS